LSTGKANEFGTHLLERLCEIYGVIMRSSETAEEAVRKWSLKSDRSFGIPPDSLFSIKLAQD
jgi:hypothetical protein